MYFALNERGVDVVMLCEFKNLKASKIGPSSSDLITCGRNLNYRIYSNEHRIWEKRANRHRPQISVEVPMRCLFEELRIT